MMKIVVFIISFLFCFSVYSNSDSVPENVKEVEKSVVLIRVKFGKEENIGTGFFIDEKTIVTNFHVISNFKSSSKLSIESPLGEISLRTIKHLSALHDLALLEVKADFQAFPVEFGLAIDKRAYIIGYPGGKLSVVKLQNVREQRGEIMAVHDQSRHLGGLSGGPILDQQNELIGIFNSSTPFTISGTSIRILKRLVTQPALSSLNFSELINTERENLNVRAIEGDFKAQYRLGIFYLLGAGVKEDVVTARTWLLKSAEQGYAPSQSNIGNLYERGLGLPQNHRKAQEWYKRAAEQGFEPAIYKLEKYAEAELNACPHSINSLQ